MSDTSHMDTAGGSSPSWHGNSASSFERALKRELNAFPSLSDVEVREALAAHRASRTVVASSKRVLVYRYWGVPLSIAAALAIGFLGIKYIPNVIHTPQTPNTQTKTYTTAPGQRANITLADGSTITLAPATTMHVTGRNVELQGEALFTVTQHKDNPFTVRTSTTITRVLGTMFGIRKYADDKETRVAVANGKVAVGEDATLAAGDVAITTPTGVRVQHDAERVLSLLSFAQGRLTIDDEPLAGAAPQISRWFGLEIRFDGQAATRRLSTVLQQETPGQALDDIARLTRTRYLRQGQVVTFYVQ